VVPLEASATLGEKLGPEGVGSDFLFRRTASAKLREVETGAYETLRRASFATRTLSTHSPPLSARANTRSKASISNGRSSITVLHTKLRLTSK